MGKIIFKLDEQSPALLDVIREVYRTKDELKKTKDEMLSNIKSLETFTNTHILRCIIEERLRRDIKKGLIDGRCLSYVNLAQRALTEDIEVIISLRLQEIYYWEFTARGITRAIYKFAHESVYAKDSLRYVTSAFCCCVEDIVKQEIIIGYCGRSLGAIYYDRMYNIINEIIGHLEIPVVRKKLLDAKESVDAWLDA